MMEAVELLSDEHIEEVRNTYLKRVKQFCEWVEKILPKRRYNLESGDVIPIEDTTGEYQPNKLLYITIKLNLTDDEKQHLLDKDGFIMHITPIGATPLIGHGVLLITGPLGEEKLIYLCKQDFEQDKNSNIRPIYRGIEKDGWYWFETYSTDRPKLIENLEDLYLLIRLVSFHDPKK